MYTTSNLTGLKDTAFFATLDESKVTIQDPAIIIWKNVTYNNGGHYSATTGAYTAPLAGYYQFTVSKATGPRYSYFSLLVDGQPFVFQFSFNTDRDDEQKTSTMAVKLEQGATVQVQSSSTTEIYGFGVFTDQPGIYSWFSGHLLFPA